jgi:hypothetical protein
MAGPVRPGGVDGDVFTFIKDSLQRIAAGCRVELAPKNVGRGGEVVSTQHQPHDHAFGHCRRRSNAQCLRAGRRVSINQSARELRLVLSSQPVGAPHGQGSGGLPAFSPRRVFAAHLVAVAFEHQGAASLPNTPRPQVLDVVVRVDCRSSAPQRGMHIVGGNGCGRDSRCYEYNGQDDLGTSGHHFLFSILIKESPFCAPQICTSYAMERRPAKWSQSGL